MSRRFAMTLAAFAFAAVPSLATAQEVVQALPSAESQTLGRALEQLSRDPGSVDALIAAGEAALAVGDTDAAVGFFGRAEERAPQNIRVMLGLASVAVRGDDPLRAIGLYDAAAAAGANMRPVQADRGLAHDLVGDPETAQALYRGALASDEKGDARRRLALSLAISGDRAGFELALAPLLARNDRASVRTRAFGLAILGQADEAVGITRDAMNAPLAARLEPYLRSMAQLTPAQQAAAGNLGKFPQTAQIGTDPAQLARFAVRRNDTQNTGRDAGARLEPRGTPLGPSGTSPARSANTTGARSANTTGARSANTAGAQSLTRSERRRVARAERQRASDPMQRSRTSAMQVRRVERPKAVSAPAPAQTPPVGVVQPQPVPVPVPVPEPVPAQGEPSPELAAVTPVRRAPEAIASIAVPPSRPEAVSPTPPESFDLAQLAPAATASPVPAPSLPTPSLPTKPAVPSVAEAFGAFAITRSRETSVVQGAVDVTQITPVRESDAPDDAPAPQANEPRYWAQIATGRDRAALRFDYRRFSRLAPDILGDVKPYIAEWNETNRLLAGPFPTSASADAAVRALKEQGVDGFRFTSAAGQEIAPLD